MCVKYVVTLASLLASRLMRRLTREVPGEALAAVAWAMLVRGLLHLVAVPLASATAAGGGLARVVLLGSEFTERVAIVWMLVFPPILVLGLSFPLLMAGARELDLFPGRSVGRLLFVNTLGAALGAAVATYLLSRWLGTLDGFLALTVLLLFFPAYGHTSYNVVAFPDPVDLGHVRMHLERLTPTARQAIRAVSPEDDGPDDPEVYLTRLLEAARKTSPGLLRQAQDRKGPLHTDDRPILEYRWAHGIPEISVLDSPLVEQ